MKSLWEYWKKFLRWFVRLVKGDPPEYRCIYINNFHPSLTGTNCKFFPVKYNDNNYQHYCNNSKNGKHYWHPVGLYEEMCLYCGKEREMKERFDSDSLLDSKKDNNATC